MGDEIDDVLLHGSEEQLRDFMDEAAESFPVDWREEETAIVDYVNERISPDELSYEWVGDEEDLALRYRDRRKRVGLTRSPRDRYICIRAINDVLAGDYELRVFRQSLDSDTHELYIKPAKWWGLFDSRDAERSAEVFKRIDETVDFQ